MFSYKEITVKIEHMIVSITLVMSTMLYKAEFVFKFSPLMSRLKN